MKGTLLAALAGLCVRSLVAMGRPLEEWTRESEAVVEANAGMERILEAPPVGIAIPGQDSIVRRVNPVATNLLDSEPGRFFERPIPWDMFCEETDTPEPPRRIEFGREVRMHAMQGRTPSTTFPTFPSARRPWCVS